jgi:hypothetical protein
MINHNPNYGLNGIYASTAYIGVNPTTPPQTIIFNRPPNNNDFAFQIGTFWLYIPVNASSTDPGELWILMNLNGNVATWIQLSGSGGPLLGLQPALNGVPNGAVVTPSGNVIQINNTDSNIVPVAGVPNPNNLNLNFNNDIQVNQNIYAGIAGGDGNLTAYSNVTGIVQGLNYNPGANCVVFQMLKQHGTINTKLPINTGDQLGMLKFGGWDGTQFTFGAYITSTSSGTIGNMQIPANLVLGTHPNSASGLNPTPRLTINPDGSIFTSGQDAASTNTSFTIGNNSGGTAKTLNLASTYNTSVGATQQMMVIDNNGFVGTNGSIAPGFQYATGTFTPSATVGGSSAGITYALQNGSYTRIGNVVTFVLTMQITSLGGLVGQFKLAGLPFTVAAIGASQDCLLAITGAFSFDVLSTSPTYIAYTYLWCSADGGATTMSPQEGGSTPASGQFLYDTNFSGTFSITVTGHYYTT